MWEKEYILLSEEGEGGGEGEVSGLRDLPYGIRAREIMENTEIREVK